MPGISQIRAALAEAAELPDHRSEEIARRIFQILKDTSSTDAALAACADVKELADLDQARRERLLFKIDLFLGLLEIGELPKH